MALAGKLDLRIHRRRPRRAGAGRITLEFEGQPVKRQRQLQSLSGSYAIDGHADSGAADGDEMACPGSGMTQEASPSSR
jgi:hypothetical protein